MKCAVMISIRPKWCELIASGKKTIEVRKTVPRLPAPFKCYIYEAQGPIETPWVDEDGHMVFKGRGMVIGEFICDTVYSVNAEHVPYLKDAFLGISCDDFLRKSCLSAYELLDYLTAPDKQVSIDYRPGYGWHISGLVIYDKPKELSEFRGICTKQYCHDTCKKFRDRTCDPGVGGKYTITRPPQSWMQVEEL
ncbi:MAG: hypothetical protein IKD01_05370 [Oscillospiraceae bacterium]|nr:hypothetical protein [Oscillospiraceae bacterium]